MTHTADGLSPQANIFVAEIGLALASNELEFPSSLEVARKIQVVLEDPDTSFEAIARVIKLEPVLAAKVLKLANSPMYNPNGNKVLNLQQALSRVGMRPLRALAFLVVGEQMANANNLGRAQRLAHQLWEYSLDVATLAWALARRVGGIDPDTAMFAGMSSQLGYFYLLAKAGKHPELLNNPQELIAVMKIWHRSISRRVLEKLEVPVSLIEAIDDSELYGGTWPPAMLADVLFVARLATPHPHPMEQVSQVERQAKLEEVFQQLPRIGFDALVAEADVERKNSLQALK